MSGITGEPADVGAAAWIPRTRSQKIPRSRRSGAEQAPASTPARPPAASTAPGRSSAPTPRLRSPPGPIAVARREEFTLRVEHAFSVSEGRGPPVVAGRVDPLVGR